MVLPAFFGLWKERILFQFCLSLALLVQMAFHRYDWRLRVTTMYRGPSVEHVLLRAARMNWWLEQMAAQCRVHRLNSMLSSNCLGCRCLTVVSGGAEIGKLGQLLLFLLASEAALSLLSE